MNLNFDASGHKPQSFDILPSGWQVMRLIEGEEKPSKNNPQNTYYAAVFEVVGGEFNGRKLFHNFNFNNTNEDAKRIAFDQLAAIMHGVGLLRINNMQELFNKPIMGKVKAVAAVMEEDGVTEKYEPKNEIKGFKPVEQAGAGGTTAAGGNSLPAGFTTGASVTPSAAAENPAAAAAQAQAATGSPAAAASIPAAITAPAAAAPTRRLVMTDKAQGGTAEQFRAHDAAWTDDLLVQEGYARWEEVEPPKPAAPSTPAVPSTPAATATAPATSTPAQTSAPAGATEDDDTPPWLQQQ
jgi:hypothetical protein